MHGRVSSVTLGSPGSVSARKMALVPRLPGLNQNCMCSTSTISLSLLCMNFKVCSSNFILR